MPCELEKLRGGGRLVLEAGKRAGEAFFNESHNKLSGTMSNLGVGTLLVAVVA